MLLFLGISSWFGYWSSELDDDRLRPRSGVVLFVSTPNID